RPLLIETARRPKGSFRSPRTACIIGAWTVESHPRAMPDAGQARLTACAPRESCRPMENWLPIAGSWTYLSCYIISVVSARPPWVDAAALLLSCSTLASFPHGLAALVLVGSGGQMAGKIVLYWAGRGTRRLQSGRVSAVLDRWRGGIEKH